MLDTEKLGLSSEKFKFHSKEILFKGLKLATINYYNCDENAEEYDFVFISQHDGSIEEFLKAYPFVIELFGGDKELLKVCSELDRDSGATALMNYIAQSLAVRGYKVATLTVENNSRAVLDTNVPISRAIRVDNLMAGNFPEVRTDFEKIYGILQQEMINLASKAKFFTDIHTLEPYEVTEAMERRPRELEEFRTFVRTQISASIKREGSFLSRSRKQDGSMYVFGDQELEELLSEKNIGLEKVGPYNEKDYLAELTTAILAEIVRTRGGIFLAFDLPKDQIGEYQQRTETSIKFDVLEERLARVGDIMIEAFIQRFNK